MQLDRLRILIGDKIELLKNSSVLILGLGGVGGFATEVLARSGIGSFILVDNDVIDITNLNRQVISNINNVGKLKTDEWEKRIKEINPKTNIIKITKFLDSNNINELLKYNFKYAIDACDTINTKYEFIKLCLNNNIKFISCMGTGKKFHPELLEITDLNKTSYDPIAKKLRKMFKNEKTNGKIPVLYSKEIPQKTDNKNIGSNAFVPSVAGIMCGKYIFDLIVGDNNEESN